jgi:hypothetical protein
MTIGISTLADLVGVLIPVVTHRTRAVGAAAVHSGIGSLRSQAHEIRVRLM